MHLPSLESGPDASLSWKGFPGLNGTPYRTAAPLTGFKCLLVHPSQQGDTSDFDHPVSLGYAASLVRMNGGEAAIRTVQMEACNISHFAGYDLVAVFPMSALLDDTLSVARKVKSDLPDSRFCFFNSDQHQHEKILGVPGARAYGRALMERFPEIDFVLIGESEEGFLSLCESIHAGKKGMDHVPGCYYRVDGGVVLSREPVHPSDFRYLPFPARDHLREGIGPDGINRQSVRIQSSRGCLSPCLYCVESSTNILPGIRRETWKAREIPRFVDEIELLAKRYGAVFFNVIDSSFEDPGRLGLSRIGSFCEEILSRGIRASFKVHLRAETIEKLDDVRLKRMKASGIDILVLGAESGLDEELRSYRKIARSEQTRLGLARLDALDLFFPLLGHMMFSPLLRLDDLPGKVSFLKEIRRGWDYLNLSNNLLVFTGTAYHTLLQKEKLTLPHDLLSPVIPYRYVDERVRHVAEELGGLRHGIPSVIPLHNGFYEAWNLVGRISNPMNAHLREREGVYRRFRGNLDDLLSRAEETYSRFFLEVVDLARSGWSADAARRLRDDRLASSIPILAEEIRSLLDGFLDVFDRAGLSTGRLHLKTWLSVINSRVDTSSGKMN